MSLSTLPSASSPLPAQTRTRSGAPTSTALTWIGGAVLPAVALIASNGGNTLALRVLAVASVGGAFAIFLTHGGRRVTAAGIYCLTAGLMAGCGAWYWAQNVPPQTTQASILAAASSIYASTMLMYVIFWRRTVVISTLDRSQCLPPISPKMAQNLRLLGILFFVIGAVAQRAGAALGTLAQSTAEVGVIFFAASLLLSGGIRVLHSPIRTFAVGASLLAYYFVVFSGGGRLRLGGLALTIVIIAQYRFRTRIKTLALAALLPALLIFASIGQTRFAAARIDSTAQAPVSGLSSLVNPLATYGQLINEHITDGKGATLLAESVTLIPRAVWPTKPVQFGRVLALRLHPELSSTNLSTPCMPQGEWYYNFSWLGLLFMIPVIGWLLRWLDPRFARWSQTALLHREQLFAFLLLAILIGSLADLAWGGTSTWLSRNLQRVLVLLPILVWSYIRPRQQARKATRLNALGSALMVGSRNQGTSPLLDQPGVTQLERRFPVALPSEPRWQVEVPASAFAPSVDSLEPAIPVATSRSGSLRGVAGRAAATLVDESLSSLQNFVILFAALHFLSVRSIGQFTLVYISASLIESTLKSLILEPLTIKFSGSDQTTRRRAGAEALGSALVLGVICFGITAAFSTAFVGETRSIILATSLVLPALIVQEGWRVYFFAIGRPRYAVFNDGFCLVSTALLVVFFVIRPHATSSALLLTLWAAGTCVGAVVGAAQTGFVPAVRQWWSWAREHWHLGSRLAGGYSAEQIGGRVALGLVGGLAGSVALGQFGASRTLVAPITTVMLSAMTFAVPEAIRLQQRGDRQFVQFALALSLILAVGVSILGVGVHFLPDNIGRIIAGKNWHLARSLLFPMIVWTAAVALGQGARVGLRVLKQPKTIIRLSTATALATVAGVVVGSASGGAAGAAWAFALVNAAVAVVWWLVFAHSTRMIEKNLVVPGETRLSRE